MEIEKKQIKKMGKWVNDYGHNMRVCAVKAWFWRAEIVGRDGEDE